MSQVYLKLVCYLIIVCVILGLKCLYDILNEKGCWLSGHVQSAQLIEPSTTVLLTIRP